jgi:hypothetical protein
MDFMCQAGAAGLLDISGATIATMTLCCGMTSKTNKKPLTYMLWMSSSPEIKAIVEHP